MDSEQLLDSGVCIFDLFATFGVDEWDGSRGLPGVGSALPDGGLCLSGKPSDVLELLLPIELHLLSLEAVLIGVIGFKKLILDLAPLPLSCLSLAASASRFLVRDLGVCMLEGLILLEVAFSSEFTTAFDGGGFFESA